MIKVNLLPPDYRKKDRTPLGRFIVIIIGVILVTSSLGFFLYVRWGLLNEAFSEKERILSVLRGLEAKGRYSDQLKLEKQEYNRRSETIQTIGNSRILWTKKLDQLADIVYCNGDTEKRMVWLDDLKVQQDRMQGKKGSHGTLMMKGYTAPGVLEKLSDFHADITNSDFFGDFFEISKPAGTLKKFKDNYEPKEAFEFNFTLKIKPPESSSGKDKPDPGKAKK